jgi:hypothetical protein
MDDGSHVIVRRRSGLSHAPGNFASGGPINTSIGELTKCLISLTSLRLRVEYIMVALKATPT